MPGRPFSKTEIAAIEARMAGLPQPDVTDPENPEWTSDDFARASGPESLSPAELAAFPRTRGRPPKAAPKIRVAVRLDPDVVDHFKAGGRGWQTRLNDALAGLVRK